LVSFFNKAGFKDLRSLNYPQFFPVDLLVLVPIGPADGLIDRNNRDGIAEGECVPETGFNRFTRDKWSHGIMDRDERITGDISKGIFNRMKSRFAALRQCMPGCKTKFFTLMDPE